MTETTSPAESPRERVMPVVEAMAKIDKERVMALLDEKHDVDKDAGIIIAHLEDESIKTPDGIYKFHGAKVLTSSEDKPNYVKPHFHNNGEEPYLIIAGDEMEINLGRVVEGDDGNKKVVWDEPRRLAAGESVIVEEGQVHSLRNTGGKPVYFLFGCPDSHLTDPPAEDADRFFTADFVDGIPSQYPKAA